MKIIKFLLAILILLTIVGTFEAFKTENKSTLSYTNKPLSDYENEMENADDEDEDDEEDDDDEMAKDPKTQGAKAKQLRTTGKDAKKDGKHTRVAGVKAQSKKAHAHKVAREEEEVVDAKKVKKAREEEETAKVAKKAAREEELPLKVAKATTPK